MDKDIDLEEQPYEITLKELLQERSKLDMKINSYIENTRGRALSRVFDICNLYKITNAELEIHLTKAEPKEKKTRKPRTPKIKVSENITSEMSATMTD